MNRVILVAALVALTAVVAAPAASANYAPCHLYHSDPVGPAICKVNHVAWTAICLADLEDRVC